MRANHFTRQGTAATAARAAAARDGLAYHPVWATMPTLPCITLVQRDGGYRVAYWNGSFYETPDTI